MVSTRCVTTTIIEMNSRRAEWFRGNASLPHGPERTLPVSRGDASLPHEPGQLRKHTYRRLRHHIFTQAPYGHSLCGVGRWGGNQPTACYYMLEPHTCKTPPGLHLLPPHHSESLLIPYSPSRSVDALHQCTWVLGDRGDLFIRPHPLEPQQERHIPNGGRQDFARELVSQHQDSVRWHLRHPHRAYRSRPYPASLAVTSAMTTPWRCVACRSIPLLASIVTTPAWRWLRMKPQPQDLP